MEWIVKGRVASLKAIEVRKSVSESVGQFDFAVLGLGRIVRKTQSVGNEPWAEVTSNKKDMDSVSSLCEAHFRRFNYGNLSYRSNLIIS